MHPFPLISQYSSSLSFVVKMEKVVGVFRLVSGFPGPSGFGSASTAQEVTEGIDATNLTALITGQRLSLLLFFAFFTSSSLHFHVSFFVKSSCLKQMKPGISIHNYGSSSLFIICHYTEKRIIQRSNPGSVSTEDYHFFCDPIS